MNPHRADLQNRIDCEPRRIKAFYLDANLVLDFFRILSARGPDHILRIPELDADLPDDAHILTCDWRMDHLAFYVIVESALFEPVPTGSLIPMLTPNRFGGFVVTWHAYRLGDDGAYRGVE